jgi:hypothetical protein
MNPNSLHIPTDIFTHEPDEVYHSKAKAYLSSHQLIDFIRCPLLYDQKRKGLIFEKESSTFQLGKAAHMRILEGQHVYENHFAVGGPINPSTGKPFGSQTKKFAEWQKLQIKPFLSQEHADLIEKMALGLSLTDCAVELISNGIAEGVLRTRYCGVDCQIRVDWLNPNRGIVDLKTCDDLTYFEADARLYKYRNQMAFYQAVMKEAIGRYVPVYLIATEKKHPHRCGVWRVSDDCLAIARHENELHIELLQSCRTRDIWPTGYEDIRLLDVT